MYGEMPRSYDAWRTAGPPDPEPECCPACGADEDAIEDCEPHGTDGCQILLAVVGHPSGTRPRTLQELRRAARRVSLYRCTSCGAIMTDDAMVPRSEWEAEH